MKLGIVGSRAYVNEARIKMIVERYISRFGADNLEIVSGGCPDGADALAKKVALDLKLEYKEFPPAHRPHNQYCVNPPTDYNRPYHVSNYFARNGEIAKYSDHVLAFVIEGVRCNGTMDTVGKARKLSKPVKIFEDQNAP